jgi:SMODS and SLOG-associating 2TM effector domain 1/Protein of unknown function (DUF4231)
MGPLEALASRQATWSATSEDLKTNLERARWATFILSVLGALFAAIASQVPETPRLYLGIGGSVLLGVVSFVSLRMLGSDRVSAWARARAASEALKREAFKFAAWAAPYDETAHRVQRLGDEQERIERDVDDLLSQTVAADRASVPIADIRPDDYIRLRVRNQVQDYCEPRAEEHRRAAVRLRRLEFGLSLAATILTGIVAVAGKEPRLGFDFIALTAVLTTVAGAIVAHIEASRYDYLVMSYRATARRLRNQLAKLVELPAAPSPEWSAFVERCETIIAEQNNDWIAKWSKPAADRH